MTKQTALNLFEITRKEFLESCRWIARKIAKAKGNVTIDDVRNEVKIPLNIDARVLGAVFNTPDFEKVGYTSTKIKSSHGRPISVFRLTPNALERENIRKECVQYAEREARKFFDYQPTLI